MHTLFYIKTQISAKWSCRNDLVPKKLFREIKINLLERTDLNQLVRRWKRLYFWHKQCCLSQKQLRQAKVILLSFLCNIKIYKVYKGLGYIPYAWTKE